MGHNIIHSQPKIVPDLSNKRIEHQCPLDHIYRGKSSDSKDFKGEKNKTYFAKLLNFLAVQLMFHRFYKNTYLIPNTIELDTGPILMPLLYTLHLLKGRYCYEDLMTLYEFFKPFI